MTFLGCASIAPETVPVSDSLTSESRDPVELLESLEQREQQFRSLRALASVTYRGSDGRGGVQEAIVVYRPDRLRLETLTPLGAILIVTADADQLIGFQPRERLFYRGRSTKKNLLRYTTIPLELEEWTSVLLGLPPVEVRGQWERKGDSLQRELGEGRMEVVTFHPNLKIPTRWQRIDPDGSMEVSALFADFFSTPNGPFPLKITLEASHRRVSLEIRYQGPELNVALPASLFAQEKPANVKEVLLESLGG